VGIRWEIFFARARPLSSFIAYHFLSHLLQELSSISSSVRRIGA
jgi:hypothetical protein